MKYVNKMYYIVIIQKHIRGFFIRKAMDEIQILKNQIELFVMHIQMYGIIKRNKMKNIISGKDIIMYRSSWKNYYPFNFEYELTKFLMFECDFISSIIAHCYIT